MTPELDALIVRSLPELHGAATRLDVLSTTVCAEIDAEIQAWIMRNDWAGSAKLHGDEDGGTWLAPKEWMYPDDPDERAHLYFNLDTTGAEREDDWYLESYTGAGQQRMGLWLAYEGWSVRKAEWNRTWRDLKNTSGLPLHGSDFFLPVLIDREALAAAIEKDAMSDALQPLRDALDRLPQLANQLEPLKQQLAAISQAKVKPDQSTKPT